MSPGPQAADCAGRPDDLGDLDDLSDWKVDLVGIDIPVVGVLMLCERQAPIDAL